MGNSISFQLPSNENIKFPDRFDEYKQITYSKICEVKCLWLETRRFKDGKLFIEDFEELFGPNVTDSEIHFQDFEEPNQNHCIIFQFLSVLLLLTKESAEIKFNFLFQIHEEKRNPDLSYFLQDIQLILSFVVKGFMKVFNLGTFDQKSFDEFIETSLNAFYERNSIHTPQQIGLEGESSSNFILRKDAFRLVDLWKWYQDTIELQQYMQACNLITFSLPEERTLMKILNPIPQPYYPPSMMFSSSSSSISSFPSPISSISSSSLWDITISELSNDRWFMTLPFLTQDTLGWVFLEHLVLSNNYALPIFDLQVSNRIERDPKGSNTMGSAGGGGGGGGLETGGGGGGNRKNVMVPTPPSSSFHLGGGIAGGGGGGGPRKKSSLRAASFISQQPIAETQAMRDRAGLVCVADMFTYFCWVAECSQEEKHSILTTTTTNTSSDDISNPTPSTINNNSSSISMKLPPPSSSSGVSLLSTRVRSNSNNSNPHQNSRVSLNSTSGSSFKTNKKFQQMGESISSSPIRNILSGSINQITSCDGSGIGVSVGGLVDLDRERGGVGEKSGFEKGLGNGSSSGTQSTASLGSVSTNGGAGNDRFHPMSSSSSSSSYYKKQEILNFSQPIYNAIHAFAQGWRNVPVANDPHLPFKVTNILTTHDMIRFMRQHADRILGKYRNLLLSQTKLIHKPLCFSKDIPLINAIRTMAMKGVDGAVILDENNKIGSILSPQVLKSCWWSWKKLANINYRSSLFSEIATEYETNKYKVTFDPSLPSNQKAMTTLCTNLICPLKNCENLGIFIQKFAVSLGINLTASEVLGMDAANSLLLNGDGSSSDADQTEGIHFDSDPKKLFPIGRGGLASETLIASIPTLPMSLAEKFPPNPKYTQLILSDLIDISSTSISHSNSIILDPSTPTPTFNNNVFPPPSSANGTIITSTSRGSSSSSSSSSSSRISSSQSNNQQQQQQQQQWSSSNPPSLPQTPAILIYPESRQNESPLTMFTSPIVSPPSSPIRKQLLSQQQQQQQQQPKPLGILELFPNNPQIQQLYSRIDSNYENERGKFPEEDDEDNDKYGDENGDGAESERKEIDLISLESKDSLSSQPINNNNHQHHQSKKESKLGAQLLAIKKQEKQKIKLEKARMELKCQLSLRMKELGAIFASDTLYSALDAMYANGTTRAFVMTRRGDVLGVVTFSDVCQFLVQQEGISKRNEIDRIEKEDRIAQRKKKNSILVNASSSASSVPRTTSNLTTSGTRGTTGTGIGDNITLMTSPTLSPSQSLVSTSI